MTKRLQASWLGALSFGALALCVNAAVATAQAVEPVDEALSVMLTATDGSAAAGAAELKGEEGQTEVEIHLHGAPADAAYTAYLITGTCEAPGEVQHALGVVEADAEGAGHGGFQIEQPLAELVATPIALQIHATGDEPGQTLLCGDLQATEPAVEDAGEVEA